MVDAKSYLVSARGFSLLLLAVTLLGLDIVFSYHGITGMRFEAREAFAKYETVKALEELLPDTDVEIVSAAGADVWKDYTGVSRSEREYRNHRIWELEKLRETRPKDLRIDKDVLELPSLDWSPARNLSKLDNYSGLKVTFSAAWLTAPTVDRLVTIFAFRIESGRTGQRPRWSYVTFYKVSDRGELSFLRDHTSDSSWITLLNSPEYDFATWLELNREYDARVVLEDIAVEVGLVPREDEDLGDLFGRVERELFDRSVSLPTLGISLPPIRAMAVISSLIVILLVLLRNRIRYVLRDPNLAVEEPWLILDAEKMLERITAVSWLVVILIAPSIVIGSTTHMVFRRLIADGGTLSSTGYAVFILLAVLFIIVTSWIALRVISMLVVLREKRHGLTTRAT